MPRPALARSGDRGDASIPGETVKVALQNMQFWFLVCAMSEENGCERALLGNTGDMSVRVGIVEDDPLLLSALRKSLQHISGIEVVVATPHSVEFLRALGQQKIDVSLLDVHLGSGPTGFDVARRARTINPRIGLVFLSSVRDPRLLGYNAEGLPPGARYLLKSNVSDISDLATTLLDVAHSALSRPQGAMPRVSLTKSQLEILRLVAEGLNNSEIAKRRVVSERAVEMAVSRLADHLGLKHKPGVNQRVHIATRFFQEMGWTP